MDKLNQVLGVANRDTVLNSVFDKIFADQAQGALDWQITESGKEKLLEARSSITVKGITGADVEVALKLKVHMLCDSGCECCIGYDNQAYLHIQTDQGPCRNDGYEPVKMLAEDVFHVKIGWHDLGSRSRKN